MNRVVILSATALASVVLAVVLFGSPDTGGNIPEAPPAAPASPDAAPPTELATEAGQVPAADALVPVELEEKRARAAERTARLAQPDAMAAARQTIAWTAVRRELLRFHDDDATALAASCAEISQRLYEARKAPDTADFATLGADQAALIEKVQRYTNADQPLRDALVHLASVQGAATPDGAN
jgi:hypothetical protein